MIVRILNIVLLSVWAVFLFWLLTFGKSDLIRLLHPRLWWILYIAVVILLLFLASFITTSGKTEQRKSILFEFPGILILLIPLMYYFIAREARLDGASLHNRIIKNDNGVYLNNLPYFGLIDESK